MTTSSRPGSSTRARTRTAGSSRHGASDRSVPSAATERLLHADPRPSAGATRSHPVALILLIAMPVVLVVIGAALLAVFAPLGAVLVVAGLAVASGNFLTAGGDRIASMVGGREVVARDEPRLFNLLEGLCVANGLSVPSVRMLDTAAPNAIVIARRKSPPLLVCTSGLLDTVDRIELEAVIAHELATLKLGDAQRAALIARAVALFARLSPLGGKLVWRLSSPDRQVRADETGVSMTRFPPGLASALARLEATGERLRLPSVLVRLTGPNWIVPLADAPEYGVRPSELDVELRIAALVER